MSLTERTLGLRLPNFFSRLARHSPSSDKRDVGLKVPQGTNAFFLPFDGLRIDWVWARTEGRDEFIYITREKTECEGGTCVQVLYMEHKENGDMIHLNAHIRGDDQLGSWYSYKEIGRNVNNTEQVDIVTALQNLRNRLLERDIASRTRLTKS